MADPESGVVVLGPDWPGRELPVMPGDLKRFVPQGLGLNVPILVTPYGIGPDQGFYGFDAPSADPLRAAPTQEPGGGTLYFDDAVDQAKLRSALELIGVHTIGKNYAVFGASSEDPVADRYLDQIRIIPKDALGHFFDAKDEAGALAEQPIALGDYLWRFVEQQRAKWNDGSTYSGKLRGTLGGDGDWAKESLAFGFFIENSYWGIYRAWSRPWLVTK